MDSGLPRELEETPRGHHALGAFSFGSQPGSRVTSDGGLILARELDERLGLGKLIGEHLGDSRQGLNKKFPFAYPPRQSVYSRPAGYEDLNDAFRVSADPIFPLIGSKRNGDRGGGADLDAAWL